MSGQRHYTPSGMKGTMDCLRSLFDIVRLVDPVSSAVFAVNEDGTLERQPAFHDGEKPVRCGTVPFTGKSRYEPREQQPYSVFSWPVVLETKEGDLPLILEVVSHASAGEAGPDTATCVSLTNWMDGMRHKAYVDVLTGAYNRRYLYEFAFLAGEGAGVPRRVGLTLLDLRSFKRINDARGHTEGDRILVEVTRALKRCVRECDAVIRLGGDEFVVLLMDRGEESVRQKTEELRRAVERVTPADFGYACTDAFRPEPECLTALLELADRRMYGEKHRRQH